jgi:hypothetical protein
MDGGFDLGHDPPVCDPVAHLEGGAGGDIADLKDLGNAADADSQRKEEYHKIRFCAQQAKRDGLDYFWVDTCCIDKTNNTELSEAINSVSLVPEREEVLRVQYLSNAEYNTSMSENELARRWKPAFKKSRWSTRGWTL